MKDGHEDWFNSYLTRLSKIQDDFIFLRHHIDTINKTVKGIKESNTITKSEEMIILQIEKILNNKADYSNSKVDEFFDKLSIVNNSK